MASLAIDVIQKLPPFTWRGLTAPPYDDISFQFAHDLAQRPWPYVDGIGHEWTGRGAIGFSLHLLFVNTLGTDLFPGLWNDWREALFDGTAGDLSHPILGDFRAHVVDCQVEVVSSRKAGIAATVKFTETIEDPEVQNLLGPTEANIEALAAEADKGLAAANISYPTGQRTTSLLELIGAINGLVLSSRLKAQGMINQAVGIIGGLIDSVDDLNDHAAWATKGHLVSLHNGMTSLAKKAGDVVQERLGRPVGIFVTPHPMTLNEVGSSVGNATGDLMGINASILKHPVLPAGTPVNYLL